MTINLGHPHTTSSGGWTSPGGTARTTSSGWEGAGADRPAGATWVWVPVLPTARKRLGLSRLQTIALIKEGRVIGQLAGGARWFIRSDSLTRWIKRHRKGCAA